MNISKNANVTDANLTLSGEANGARTTFDANKDSGWSLAGVFWGTFTPKQDMIVNRIHVYGNGNIWRLALWKNDTKLVSTKRGEFEPPDRDKTREFSPVLLKAGETYRYMFNTSDPEAALYPNMWHNTTYETETGIYNLTKFVNVNGRERTAMLAVRFSGPAYPRDIQVDIGDDGTTEADTEGILRSQTMFEVQSPVNAYLQSHSGEGSDNISLPIAIQSEASGTIQATVRMTAQTAESNLPPIADFEFAPTRPTAGDTVTFNASTAIDPDGNITAYEWDLDGDGTYEHHGKIVTRSFSTGGEHLVRLAVTDNDGARNVTQQTVAVANQSTTATIGFNETELTGSQGETFWLAVEYTAPVEESSTEVYAVQLLVEYNTTYLDLTDTRIGPYLGGSSNTIPISNTIDDERGTYDFGVTRTTDDGVTGSGDVAYLRFEVASATDAPLGPETKVTFSEATVSDPDGNAIQTDRVNTTLDTVDPIPPTSVIAANKTVVNVSESVRFDASASTDNFQIRSYAWEFGHGAITSDQTVTHTFTAPGEQVARLTVTDGDGNTNTTTTRIQVLDTEPPTATLATPSTAEVNRTVGFSVEASDNHRVATFAWDFDGDGTVDATTTTPNASHTYTQLGTVTPTVKVSDTSDNNVTAKGELKIQDTTPPTAQIHANRTKVHRSGVVAFNAHGSTDNYQIASYRWDFQGDGVIDLVSSDPVASYRYAAPGNFTPTVTVNDTAGNTASASTSVLVPNATMAFNTTNRTVTKGDSFRVAVILDATTGNTATEIAGTQFTVTYNTSVLTAVDLEKGSYLGQDTIISENAINRQQGTVQYGESIQNGVTTGSGEVAVINFTATESIQNRVQTTLSISSSKVGTPGGKAVPTERSDASVVVIPNEPPTVNASVTTTVNNVGAPIKLEVDATDPDGVVQSVSLRSGATPVTTITCQAPACTPTLQTTPQQSTWNQSRGAYDTATYVVKGEDDSGAQATQTVQTAIYITGDATGDGTVNIFDAVSVGQAWRAQNGDPAYSDAADLNNDGSVDIFDAVVIGQNWRRDARTD